MRKLLAYISHSLSEYHYYTETRWKIRWNKSEKARPREDAKKNKTNVVEGIEKKEKTLKGLQVTFAVAQ